MNVATSVLSRVHPVSDRRHYPVPIATSTLRRLTDVPSMPLIADLA
jgi:hypothetical protein